MTDLIALNKLVASTDNARKTGIADGLEELAASIAAHGLLQWQDRLPDDRADLWAWCLEQPQDTLLDLMAICAAHTVDAVQTKHGGQDAGSLRHADDLARALKLDMGSGLRPPRPTSSPKSASRPCSTRLPRRKERPAPPHGRS